ncbi:MAG: tetratricopeptide repeat protein [Cyanobacteria bacterium P01_D01_bin.1]
MQYLEPFQNKSDYLSRYSSKLKAVVAVVRGESSRKRLAQSTHRVNVDGWLSRADANLLLRKRAQYEAQQGNYAAAIKLLDQLIAYESDNPNVFVNRGLMYSSLRRYDEAMADYNRAIQLNPALDKAYSNRANLYTKRQQWEDAIADYDQAIDLNPLNIRARLNQAITFRDINDYEEAILCLDIALFLRPKSATLYSERGRTYHLQGHWNQALADYTIACRLAQDSSLADISSPIPVISRVLGWMNSLISL